MENKLFNALSTICWYNCHYEWLIKLGYAIDLTTENEKGFSLEEAEKINPNIGEWDTEEHFIWMILVSMFGDWGTSVRSGWLELRNKKEIVNFLKELIKDCYFSYDDYDTFKAINGTELTEEEFNILKSWLEREI